MTLTDLEQVLDTVPTTGSYAHIVYNKVAILWLEKDKKRWNTFGGKSNPGETPKRTAARGLLEEIKKISNETSNYHLTYLQLNDKNLRLVEDNLTYIGSSRNKNCINYTHHFALAITGLKTSGVNIRHVIVDNLRKDAKKVNDVNNVPLYFNIKGKDIAVLQAAAKMSLKTIPTSKFWKSVFLGEEGG